MRQRQALRLLLPPAGATAFFWVTSLNPVTPLEALSAYLLLGMAWWSYCTWKRDSREQIPFFAGIALSYWVYFAVPLFWGDRTLPGRPAVTYASDDTITAVMLMAVLGVFCIWLGMKSRLGRRFALRRVVDVPPDPARWGYLRYLLVGGALLNFIPGAQSLGGAAGQQIFPLLQSTIPLLIFIFLFRSFLRGTTSPVDRYALLVYVGIEFVVGVSSGWLGAWLTVALAALVVYLAERKKLPILPIIILALYALFFQAGKQEYRRLYWNGTGPQAGDLARVETWAQLSLAKWQGTLTNPQGGGIGPQDFQDVVARLSLLTQAANVVDLTPSHVPYQYGRSYTFLALQFVPRFIWSDKPSMNAANQYYQVAYGLTATQNLGQVSIAVGALAEAYMNFGWPGVVLIMFLLGVVFGFVERTFLARGRGLLYSCIGIALFLNFLSVEMQMSQYLGGVLQRVVIPLLVFLPATRTIGGHAVRGVAFRAGRGRVRA